MLLNGKQEKKKKTVANDHAEDGVLQWPPETVKNIFKRIFETKVRDIKTIRQNNDKENSQKLKAMGVPARQRQDNLFRTEEKYLSPPEGFIFVVGPNRWQELAPGTDLDLKEEEGILDSEEFQDVATKGILDLKEEERNAQLREYEMEVEADASEPENEAHELRMKASHDSSEVEKESVASRSGAFPSDSIANDSLSRSGSVTTVTKARQRKVVRKRFEFSETGSESDGSPSIGNDKKKDRKKGAKKPPQKSGAIKAKKKLSASRRKSH